MPFAALSLAEFLDQVAAKTPAPGGGAVASTVGALGAALAQMVVNYSVGKKSLAQHQPVLEAALKELNNARGLLLGLAEEDAAAYGLVNELMRRPETDERRQREWAQATRAAVQIPQAVTAAAINMLRLFETLTPITNPQLKSDLAIAAVLAEAAARSGAWNVRVNAGLLPAAEQPAILADLERSLKEAAARCLAVEAACRS